jgi:hypothetical protein
MAPIPNLKEADLQWEAGRALPAAEAVAEALALTHAPEVD